MISRLEQDENLINEIKFEKNEVITECTVIELQKTINNNNYNKKYIALGVTSITEDENIINAKIKLFEYKG